MLVKETLRENGRVEQLKLEAPAESAMGILFGHPLITRVIVTYVTGEESTWTRYVDD